MLKKISSILITLSLLLSMVTIGYAADEKSAVTPNNDMAIKLLTDLGIIQEQAPGQEFDTQSITRAEYLDMLVQILLKTQVTETKLVNPFDDVYEGHPYFSSICYGYGVSIIDGGEKFEPDAPADLDFALNAAAGILGYRFVKSYIPSWTQFIDRSDLTENIVITDGLFSKNDAYTMVYNALATDCIQLISGGSEKASYGVVPGETLGGKYFGLEFISGRMIATEFASLTGTKAQSKSVVINDKAYSCNLADRFSYIGMYVDAVANEGGEIIAIGPNARDNEVTVINAEDYIDFDGYRISYYKGTSQKKVLVDNATVIYNGVNVSGSDFTTDLFDISEGKITLVKSKKGNVDLIIIDEYKNFIVSSKTEKSVNEYEVYAMNKNATKVVLDLNGESKLTDAEGKAVSVDTITRGSLLTYRMPLHGEFVEAIISNNTVTATATGKKSDSNGLTKVTLNGVEYNVTKDVWESTLNKPELNASYVWYITPFGSVGAIDYSVSNVDLEGFIMSVYTDTAGDEGYIKVVDSKNNEKDLAVKYQLKKKLLLDGESVTAAEAVSRLKGESTAALPADVRASVNRYNNFLNSTRPKDNENMPDNTAATTYGEAYLNKVSSIIGKTAYAAIYRVNEDGVVYQIDTALIGENEDVKTTLQEIMLKPRWMYSDLNNAVWYYVHPGSQKARIEGKYYLPTAKNLYAVNSDMSNIYLKSGIGDYSRDKYKPGNLKMYRKGNSTYSLNAVVYVTAEGQSISTEYVDRQFYMIDKVSEVVADNGEVTLHLDTIYKGAEKAFNVNPTTYERYRDAFSSVAKGDLVQLSFDDLNQINGIAVKVPYKARSAANGGMSGVGLQWTVKRENPDDPEEITWEGFTNGATNGGNADYSYNNEDYQIFGKVYSIEYDKDMSKYLVSVYTSATYDEDKIETFICGENSFVLYDGEEHATVDPASIKTYKDYGEDCDTLFACIYYSVLADCMFFRTY